MKYEKLRTNGILVQIAISQAKQTLTNYTSPVVPT